MTSTTEDELTCADGFKLYTKTWHTADSDPKAIVAFLHGFSDHCNQYYELFPYLASVGIEVRSFDQRGWGRSVKTPSQRGLTGPTTTVISDLCTFLSTLPTGPNSPPLFLAGHSMGGGLTLYYHLLTLLSSTSHPQTPGSPLPSTYQPPHLSGIILESPYIALPPSNTPSLITVAVGRLAGKLLPGRQLKSKMDPSFMSRDPVICKAWDDDPLCHDTTTLEGAAGMLDRHGELESLSKGKHQSTRFHPLFSSSATTPLSQSPILVFHGTSDKATSYPASKSLFTSSSSEAASTPEKLPFIPSVQFRSYDNGYHKIHADGEGVAEDFRRSVGDWVLDIVGKGKGEGMGGGGEGAKL